MENIETYSATAPKEKICRNCSAHVAGNFCSNCGQEYTEKILSLRELFSEIFDEFISWDSKITRSLTPLLTRPGFLTEEYIRGRWASYLVPSRMYIIINVIFFFFVRNFDPLTFDQAKGMAGIPENFSPSPEFLSNFNSFVEDKFPAFLFVLIPFFALGMHLLYRRPKHFLVEHMIFSFHYFAFMLIALTPGLIIIYDIITSLALFAVLPAYLFFALRRVFDQGWVLTAVKTAALYIWFMTLLVIYFNTIFSFAFNAAKSG